MIDTAWEQGKENEIGFWKNWLAKNGKMFEQQRQGDPRFIPYLTSSKQTVIANIGAGAVNMIGEVWEGYDVRVVASDLLADEYHKLLYDLSLHPITRIAKENMEFLTYPDELFDVVYCANALDHCLHPLQAIHEMIRIAKTGGYVHFHHFQHEGKRQGYHGLHQWNLDLLPDGDCRFWKRHNEEQFLLSSIHAGFVNTVVHGKNADKVQSVLHKL